MNTTYYKKKKKGFWSVLLPDNNICYTNFLLDTFLLVPKSLLHVLENGKAKALAICVLYYSACRHC